METSNTAPTSDLSGVSANSSVGTLTNQSQIFIHPDHEAGILNIPPIAKIKSTNLKIEIFFSIILFISVVLAALLVFIVLPRSQTVIFANTAKEAVTASSEKTEKVSSSLDLLYKALTNQKASDVTLSDNTVSSNFVLGIQTQASENVSVKAIALLNTVKENFDRGSKVKGFSVPKDDPNKEIRNQRTLAQDIATKVAEIQRTNEKLSELKIQNVPKNAKDLQDAVSDLSIKTQKYADQADKTAKYYVALSDTTMTLNNLAQSIVTSKDIDTGISVLTILKNKFEGLRQTEVPEGIDEYNKDIVRILDLLLNFYKDIKAGKINSLSALNSSYSNFITQLKALSITSTSDQLNFWQNNRTLSKWEQLSTDHIKLLTAAKKVKDKNSFFLLNWIGIN